VTVLAQASFWYGLVTGVLLTVTSALLFTAYIHHKIEASERDLAEAQTEQPDPCPLQGSCPAYIPEARSSRCTEINECQPPGPDPYAS
jgi:hypothetical protein